MTNVDEYVSLAEAATLLGVSKATLRNWDKAGKLNAVRHPLNLYRIYSLAELKQLQQQLGLPWEQPASTETTPPDAHDLRAVRRTIGRLHDVLRNADSQSNIIGRFDEITKLIFAKAISDRTLGESGSPFVKEQVIRAAAVRSYYESLAFEHAKIIPPRFRSLDCSDSAILQCSDVLKPVRFSTTRFDFKGMAYEEIIRNTFDKGDHQQFFTPPHIVDFIVEMCEPFIHGEICDPAAGTGGFLASIARHGFGDAPLTAFEIDERLGWVSGINMFLHDAKNIRIVILPSGGTLGDEALQYFGLFDTIITNPPFGSDFNDQAALESMQLGSGRVSRRRGILFIERCYRLLRDNGTLAIIIDEGVLNLPHAIDVRRFITANFDVKAIINLPDTAFMPYAAVNASILVLQKRVATDNNQAVFFARAETVGRKPNGDEDIRYDRDGKSYLESDLPDTLNSWREYLGGHKPQNSSTSYVADLAQNLLKDENGHRIDFQYHHPARIDSAKLLAACPFKLVRLGEVCAERNNTLIPSQELPDAVIRYTGLAHIQTNTGVAEQVPTPAISLKSGVKRYEPGDIVFARMRPNLRKVALMSFSEGGYVSPECSVLVVNPSDDGSPVVDPLLLAVLLRSDFVYGQIMHMIAGIGRPRISATELREVMVPMVPRDRQNALKMEYLAQEKSASALKVRASKLQREAEELIQIAVGAVATGFSGSNADRSRAAGTK
jgi:type I restriction enzyme M protein